MRHIALAIWYTCAYQHYLDMVNCGNYHLGLATVAEFVAFGMYTPVHKLLPMPY